MARKITKAKAKAARRAYAAAMEVFHEAILNALIAAHVAIDKADPRHGT